MNSESLMKAINELPEEKQKEVMNFVAFLKQKTQKKSEDAEKKRQFGYAKGFFKMSKNFDEPLKDFKPYME